METRSNWPTGETTHPNTTRNTYSKCALSRARFVIIGVVIGALIAGIGLGTVVTMYVSDQSKTIASTTQTTSSSITSTSSTSSSTSSTSSTSSSTSSTSSTTSSTSSTSVTTTTTTSPIPYSYIFWSFDSNCNDMYNVYNGVPMNGASYTSPGYTGYGSALSLDGSSSQYVLVSNYKDMRYTSFTWEVWSYPTNLTNFDNMMLGMCETPNNSRCMHWTIRTNRTYFGFYANDCQGSTILQTNRWYHIAFVYDYPTLTQYIYLDGVLDGINNSSAPFQGANGVMTIGALNTTSGPPASFWSGYIDQMSYVSRAKTAAEILTDATLVAYYSFDNGSLLDSGPNKINGTAVGASRTAGRVNDSLLFNTSGAYFQAGGFTLLGVVGHEYSISLWVNKLSSASAGGTLAHVSGSSNGTLWCISMLGLTTSDEIIGESWNNSIVAVQGPALVAGVWTHIVTSYSLTNGVRLWINGSLIGSSPQFTYAASNLANWITIGTTFSDAVQCAHGNVSIGQFYGMIDEMKVYSRELTSSDVYQLANP
ncbi:unnamed protein product [Adineta ricciae]|uniref:LamG-like jellyroll fold domain-containing protein n=1 Tax=Adineta ricciae TaxID=249248 RepID=A0A814QSC5_ADIRI|nr:unnamed protein product [Adineta ricciae]CAF1188623.1 unnamed protein product [Adineta ricciae]